MAKPGSVHPAEETVRPGVTGTDQSPQDWTAQYLAGATLDEVTQLSGLSKQGVADNLRGRGIHVRSTTETNDLRLKRVIAERGDEIRTAFLQSRSLETVAEQTDLKLATIKRAITDLVPDHKVLLASPRPYAKRYSDQELLNLLRDAAAGYDGNLTTAAYDSYVEASPRLPDGRVRPSHQSMLLRFDSWGSALTAAGLPANRHGGPDKRFGDASTAIAGIVACWRDLGKPPRVEDYDRWKLGRTEHPSSAIVRRLIGGSWNVGLVQAWQVIHETTLEADDPERVSPELIGNGSAAIFAPYHPADESITIQGALDLTLPNYLAQERALRSHARIQNAVAAAIVVSGLTPLSPTLGSPQFDLSLQSGTQVVVVEVKSSTADNVEFQMRVGLGQVLRYRSQLAATHVGRVRAALAVEIDPGDGWRRLLMELGVGLLIEATIADDLRDLVVAWKLTETDTAEPTRVG